VSRQFERRPLSVQLKVRLRGEEHDVQRHLLVLLEDLLEGLVGEDGGDQGFFQAAEGDLEVEGVERVADQGFVRRHRTSLAGVAFGEPEVGQADDAALLLAFSLSQGLQGLLAPFDGSRGFTHPLAPLHYFSHTMGLKVEADRAHRRDVVEDRLLLCLHGPPCLGLEVLCRSGLACCGARGGFGRLRHRGRRSGRRSPATHDPSTAGRFLWGHRGRKRHLLRCFDNGASQQEA